MVLKHTDFKKILESATIALGACSLVVLVAVITIKSHTPDKSMSGMGGLETPGLPIVSDEMIEGVAQDIDTPYTEHIELSYAAYRVKPGDMIGIIAQENGITEDTFTPAADWHLPEDSLNAGHSLHRTQKRRKRRIHCRKIQD